MAWLYEGSWFGAGSFKGKSISKYSSAITEIYSTMIWGWLKTAWLSCRAGSCSRNEMVYYRWHKKSKAAFTLWARLKGIFF